MMKKTILNNVPLFKYIRNINNQRFFVTMRVYDYMIDINLGILYANGRQDTIFLSRPGLEMLNRKNKFNDIFSCVYTNRPNEIEFKLLYEYFLNDFELTFGL